MPASVMATAAATAAARPWAECGVVCFPSTGKLQLRCSVHADATLY